MRLIRTEPAPPTGAPAMSTRRWIPIALLLSGCASSGSTLPGASVDRTTTYIDTGAAGAATLYVESWVNGNITTSALPGEPADVWDALLEVQAELELPVNFVDAQKRSTGMQAVRVRKLSNRRPGLFLDCGRGNAGEYANTYDVYVTLVSQVLPSEKGGSELRTQLEAVAKDAAHGNNTIRCTSSRRLEKEIAQGIRARL